ncbi:hypothetical protein D3C85_1062180 [compost metagenome]
MSKTPTSGTADDGYNSPAKCVGSPLNRWFPEGLSPFQAPRESRVSRASESAIEWPVCHQNLLTVTMEMLQVAKRNRGLCRMGRAAFRERSDTHAVWADGYRSAPPILRGAPLWGRIHSPSAPQAPPAPCGNALIHDRQPPSPADTSVSETPARRRPATARHATGHAPLQRPPRVTLPPPWPGSALPLPSLLPHHPDAANASRTRAGRDNAR